jgi:hypothetical protein
MIDLKPCSPTCTRHQRCWRIRVAQVTARAEATAPRVEFDTSRGPNALDDSTVAGRRALALRQRCYQELSAWYKSSRYVGETYGPEQDPPVADVLRGEVRA